MTNIELKCPFCGALHELDLDENVSALNETFSCVDCGREFTALQAWDKEHGTNTGFSRQERRELQKKNNGKMEWNSTTETWEGHPPKEELYQERLQFIKMLDPAANERYEKATHNLCQEDYLISLRNDLYDKFKRLSAIEDEFLTKREHEAKDCLRENLADTIRKIDEIDAEREFIEMYQKI